MVTEDLHIVYLMDIIFHQVVTKNCMKHFDFIIVLMDFIKLQNVHAVDEIYTRVFKQDLPERVLVV